jgi:uncharacterized alkaline shock family protein YloU
MTETEFVISEAAVASVAAAAAMATPGVVRLEPGLVGLITAWGRAARQRWQGLDPAPADGVTVRFDGGTVTVHIDLVASGADQVAAVGQAVQRAVTRMVAERTGVPVGSVTVSILDIDPVV